jgi:hypothetical protein
MGLDMYLQGRALLSAYSRGGNQSTAIKNILSQININRQVPYLEVCFDLIYWRKANAIHAWFVKNVQNGVDDCGAYYVDRVRLVDLRDLCDEVLADKTLAETCLPTTSGFFFGGIVHDEYYFEQLEHTSKSITNILNDPSLKDISIYYKSSW